MVGPFQRLHLLQVKLGLIWMHVLVYCSTKSSVSLHFSSVILGVLPDLIGIWTLPHPPPCSLRNGKCFGFAPNLTF